MPPLTIPGRPLVLEKRKLPTQTKCGERGSPPPHFVAENSKRGRSKSPKIARIVQFLFEDSDSLLPALGSIPRVYTSLSLKESQNPLKDRRPTRKASKMLWARDTTCVSRTQYKMLHSYIILIQCRSSRVAIVFTLIAVHLCSRPYLRMRFNSST